MYDTYMYLYENIGPKSICCVFINYLSVCERCIELNRRAHAHKKYYANILRRFLLLYARRHHAIECGNDSHH